MKKSKDVKFIIYQALYIFVVCVIAIKGANLDLSQVVEDDGTPKVILTPEAMDSLMKIIKTSVVIDTTKFAIVSKDLLRENDKLRSMVEQTRVQFSSNFTPIDQTKVQPIEEKKIEEMEQKEEILLGKFHLVQYTSNTLNNPYNVPLEVVGITTIPAKSSKTFETGGQSTVVIKVGSQSKTVELSPNEKPKINIQKLTTMGEGVRVTTLQRTSCFRVTVTDDFLGQLDVKFSTGVIVKQSGAGVYDVTMNFFGSKSAFDNYVENRDEPYSVGFTVTVTDRIAGHKITGQQTFTFGEW